MLFIPSHLQVLCESLRRYRPGRWPFPLALPFARSVDTGPCPACGDGPPPPGAGAQSAAALAALAARLRFAAACDHF